MTPKEPALPRRLPLFGDPNLPVFGSLLIVVVMFALYGVVLWQNRSDARRHAAETARNLALMVERDAVRNVEIYDLSLQSVADGVARREVMALPRALRNDVLFDRAASAEYLGVMLAIDAQGRVIAQSRSSTRRTGNYAQRDFFTAQRDDPRAGLYISRPYPAPSAGDALSIAFSRRIARPDGSFGGVVVGAMRLEYFRRLLAGLQLGAHGSVALMMTDGTLVMRQPYNAADIGRNLTGTANFTRFMTAPEGTFSGDAAIDGTRRLYVFRRFGDLPLLVDVAFAEQDIYAPLYRRAVAMGLLLALLGGALVCVALLLSKELRRRLRAETELRMLARTDSLTGLDNRRVLDEQLAREWARARRLQRPLAVLFIDIDRFKAYNDGYGHQAGDEALAAVARSIAAQVGRTADLVARYGGEEFIAVLPGANRAAAARLAERMRAAVAALAIAHAGSEHGRITVSIGAAWWDGVQPADPTALVRTADAALYRAKVAGRNQVVAAEPETVAMPEPAFEV